MEPIRQLWNGVDTVKVNFGVAWSDSFTELLAKLDQYKQHAMNMMEPVVFSLCRSNRSTRSWHCTRGAAMLVTASK